jgi:hypothetical protein
MILIVTTGNRQNTFPHLSLQKNLNSSKSVQTKPEESPLVLKQNTAFAGF